MRAAPDGRSEVALKGVAEMRDVGYPLLALIASSGAQVYPFPSMSGDVENAIRNRIVGLRAVKAKDLLPDPDNPRTHPKAQKEAMRGLFDEIGWADTLKARELPDGRLMLIDGHMRAEMNPDEDVPVLVLDVDEAEAKKLLATLDPIRNMAGVQKEKLAEILSQIKTSSPALASLLGHLAETAKAVIDPREKRDKRAEAEEFSKKWQVRNGDVFSIGRHRIMCGDCTDPSDVSVLMGNDIPGLIVTSPPYADQRSYGAHEATVGSEWADIVTAALTLPVVPEDAQILVNLGLVHRDGELVEYWDDWKAAMRTAGWKLTGWYVWDKGAAMFGETQGRLRVRHEWVFHYNKKSVQPNKWVPSKSAGQRITHNTHLRHTGVRDEQQRDDTIEPFRVPDSVIAISTGGQDETASAHPAKFPEALPEYFIRTWDGLVYDPFSGSGTTTVAAQALGRPSLAMEIDPLYVAISLERLSKLGLEVKCLTS